MIRPPRHGKTAAAWRMFPMALAAAMTCAQAMAQSEPPPGRLVLRGGDTLSGRPTAYDPKQGWIWESPHLAAPWQVKDDAVAAIILGLPEEEPQAGVVVRLTNGDAWCGRLVDWTPDHAVLDTRAGGRLSLPTQTIASLTPVPAPKPGTTATGFKGWRPAPDNERAATLADNEAQFHEAGAIQSSVVLTPAHQLAFDVDLGDTLNTVTLAILPPADGDAEGNDTALCRLTVSRAGGELSCPDFVPSGGALQQSFAGLLPEHFHVSLVTDGENGRLMANADRRFALAFAEGPKRFPAGPCRLRLECDGPVRITGFSAAPWRGLLPDKTQRLQYHTTDGWWPKTASGLGPSKGIAGRFLGLADGLPRFEEFRKPPLTPVIRTLKWESVHRITLANRLPAEPAADDAAEIWFDDWRRASLRITGLKDGKLLGHSTLLGDCAIHLDALCRIHPQGGPHHRLRKELLTADPAANDPEKRDPAHREITPE